MRVGFVCTNYNNSAFTKSAVASLRSQRGGHEVRIVVVDNHSHDADVAALRELGGDDPHVEIVFGTENVGYFAGLNIGIRRLRESCPDIAHVIVGNNDLVFPGGFLDAMHRHREVFEQWAVVAPDLVTPDGVHQNPHVAYPIGPLRKFVWDVFYTAYPLAVLILLGTRLAGALTLRPERSPNSELHKVAGPIEMGFGACYILGPRFFASFPRLCAATFLMQEEFFLSEQLARVGQKPYYDPRFVIEHHDHATTNKIPRRHYWRLSRDAHLVYKRYLGMTPAEKDDFIAAASR